MCHVCVIGRRTKARNPLFCLSLLLTRHVTVTMVAAGVRLFLYVCLYIALSACACVRARVCKTVFHIHRFCCAMLCISAAYICRRAVSVCPSVRLAVCHASVLIRFTF